MRQKIVAGNWKMNKDVHESMELLRAIQSTPIPEAVRVMIAPPTLFLDRMAEATQGHPLQVVSQNMNAAASGAFTGEISAEMLKSISIQATLLGHSERRAYYNETNETLSKKVKTAQENGMEIIFCFGEELADRKSNKHFEVVSEQLETGLFSTEALDWSNIILAYEPVWAIGTGETASPQQAQEMHAFIRSQIQNRFGAAIAEATSILYGGSVKPSNAVELFSQEDVDGGLIGGASLQAEDFLAIVNAI